MTNPLPTDSELEEILANNGVYDGKTSLYFQPEVDEFKSDLLAWRNAYTAQQVERARIEGRLQELTMLQTDRRLLATGDNPADTAWYERNIDARVEALRMFKARLTQQTGDNDNEEKES